MNGETIGIAVAFSAGLLSFLSPCVLPLVPSYLSFITGMSLEDVGKARKTAVLHTLLFVSGFTLIFLALGATATIFGRLLMTYQVWISRVGGTMVIIFGLFLLGVLNIGAFQRERRLHLADKPLGYLGTVFVGVAFGAGWTPCIGPVLGGILAYAAKDADLGRGLMLLFAYSLGLAVPFIAASAAIGKFFQAFTAIRKHLGTINRVAGAMLVVVGVLMVTNRFTMMSGWFRGLTPQWLLERL